jgi:hypothetical protein
VSNLDDFNDGWTAGWHDQPQETGRGPSYKNAYNAAAKARRNEQSDKRD